KKKHYLVTGGTGFIGSAVVKRLLSAGYRVTILDDNSRGRNQRIQSVAEQVHFVNGDVRNPEDVMRAAEGVDAIAHLAYVNGTEFFYTKPELILEVGVKGIVNTLDACLKYNIREFILASSSEVYQMPPHVPTSEEVPLVVPDPLNPRYSYGGGKIISELMAINYGRKFFDRVLIFRPHNVYGEDMGWEHVIPQFALRMGELHRQHPNGKIPFKIQGEGSETRSFIYIDDFADGFMDMLEKGENLGIYHIGTTEEVSIRSLAEKVAKSFGRECEIIAGPLQKGGTPRRCPDIKKIGALGFKPRLGLDQTLSKVVRWYDENRQQATAFGSNKGVSNERS
ncbi:MAG: NAD-dependent epimerase/dehydratase family protein, partial [Pseudobdellovibrionaceae bacterium]